MFWGHPHAHGAFLMGASQNFTNVASHPSLPLLQYQGIHGWDTTRPLWLKGTDCNSKWLTQFQPSGLLKLSVCARYRSSSSCRCLQRTKLRPAYPGMPNTNQSLGLTHHPFVLTRPCFESGQRISCLLSNSLSSLSLLASKALYLSTRVSKPYSFKVACAWLLLSTALWREANTASPLVRAGCPVSMTFPMLTCPHLARQH